MTTNKIHFKVIHYNKGKYDNKKERIRNTFYRCFINGFKDDCFITYSYNANTKMFQEPILGDSLGIFFYTRTLSKRKMARFIKKWNLHNVNIICEQIGSTGIMVIRVK